MTQVAFVGFSWYCTVIQLNCTIVHNCARLVQAWDIIQGKPVYVWYCLVVYLAWPPLLMMGISSLCFCSALIHPKWSRQFASGWPPRVTLSREKMAASFSRYLTVLAFGVSFTFLKKKRMVQELMTSGKSEFHSCVKEFLMVHKKISHLFFFFFFFFFF